MNKVQAQGKVQELDLREYLEKLAQAKPIDIVKVVACTTCGAEVTPKENAVSFPCPFCGSNIVSQAHECSIIRPNAILPFKVTRDNATDLFRRWLRSLWWAPGTLKKRSMLDATLTGVYLPHWTYDAFTQTQYAGERGDAYYETQYVTVNGQRQARQVRKVRWSPASGTVEVRFDDILIPASTSLETRRVAELTPWDLQACVAYQPDYLAGFAAERYSLALGDGFKMAQERMQPVIHSMICRDIGGDEQRVRHQKTRYDDLTFKHVLLPIWMSAYRYRGKVYRFIVNARTGEVQGERPYSAWKIGLAVFFVVIFILIIFALLARS
jgi:predicted RNA-binding Zn-ribbon protein involved in translation (DUF1610 family)